MFLRLLKGLQCQHAEGFVDASMSANLHAPDQAKQQELEPSETGEYAYSIDELLNDVRRSNVHKLAGTILVANFALFVVFLVKSLYAGSTDGTASRMVGILLSSCFFYAIAKAHIELTSWSMDIIHVAVHSLPMLEFLSYSETERRSFEKMMPALVAVRFCLGVVFLKQELTTACNAVLSAAVICCAYAAEDLTIDSCLSEAIVFVCLALGANIVERLVKERLAASLQMQVSEHSHQTARRLLAVLCDCELLLNSALQIIRPCPKLSSLLMGIRPTTAGDDFAKYVHEDDIDRFRQFIHDSSCNAEAGSDQYSPASLQVALRDAVGLTVQVELFHAAVPSPLGSGRLNHMLGINEINEYRNMHNAERAAASQQNSAPNWARPDSTSREQQSQQGDNRSLSTLSSPPSSASAVAGAKDLPHLDSITLTLDVMSPLFTISKASIAWDTSQSPEDELPTAAAWVQERSWNLFRDWVQSQVNISFSNFGEPYNLESLELCMPGSNSSVLLAGNVSFVGLSQEAESNCEESEEANGDAEQVPPCTNDEHLLVDIQMCEFSACRHPKPRRHQQNDPRREQGLAVIHERI